MEILHKYKNKTFDKEIRGKMKNTQFKNCVFSDFFYELEFKNCLFNNCVIRVEEWESEFQGCSFTNCQISIRDRGNTGGSHVEQCTFTNCKIAGDFQCFIAEINGCIFEGAHITMGEVRVSEYSETNYFHHSDFGGINFVGNIHDCVFLSCEFYRLIVENTRWENVTFVSCKSPTVEFKRVKMSVVQFINCVDFWGELDIIHDRVNVKYINSPHIKEVWKIPYGEGKTYDLVLREYNDPKYEASLGEVRKYLENYGYPEVGYIQFQLDYEDRTRCRKKRDDEKYWKDNGISYVKDGNAGYSNVLTVVLGTENDYRLRFVLKEAYIGQYRPQKGEPSFDEFWDEMYMSSYYKLDF